MNENKYEADVVRARLLELKERLKLMSNKSPSRHLVESSIKTNQEILLLLETPTISH